MVLQDASLARDINVGSASKTSLQVAKSEEKCRALLQTLPLVTISKETKEEIRWKSFEKGLPEQNKQIASPFHAPSKCGSHSVQKYPRF